MNKPILEMTREEVKNHILTLQEHIASVLKSGKDLDEFLDETDIFDEFEEILPDKEFPIFVITILNGFQSEVILEKLLDILQSCKNG
tara:strand:- start:3638 stop:3898 length:261 start_codon:yes stop_codon:yes gene_type:complete